MSWLGKWAGSTFGQWFGDRTEQAASGPTWFQHVKFTAIQDAEAKVYGSAASNGVGRFTPQGTAEPLPFGVTASATSFPWAPSTDATASVKKITVLAGAGSFVPETDVEVFLRQVTGNLSVGESTPVADSTANVWGSEAVSGAGSVYPYGVKNLTDEELALIALQLSRRTH